MQPATVAVSNLGRVSGMYLQVPLPFSPSAGTFDSMVGCDSDGDGDWQSWQAITEPDRPVYLSVSRPHHQALAHP